MNAWSKSRSKKKSPNLYVEIKLEESVQKTEVIERNKAPSWNEEFKMYVVFSLYTAPQSAIRTQPLKIR
jgi:Ca2+-dependent lipid-binding protein